MLRIEAIQSGQMVPVPKAWTFDSKNADPAEIAELSRVLESSDFFAVEVSPARRAQPDRGTLSILVETDHGSRRLTMPLGSIPEKLAPLVRFVESRLQWKPHKS
jgi:Emfourin